MPAPSGHQPQAAVIATRGGKVCLITSSSGRRLVLPKGTVATGWDAPETAVQQAWEEAGLVGDLDPEPVGQYEHEKDGTVRLVTVYRLHVTDVYDAWPQCEARRRAWLTPAEASWRVDVPGLKDVIRAAFLLEPSRSRVAL